MPSHPATCFLGQLPLSTRVQARYKRGRGPLTKKRYSRGITETSHIGDANHTVTSEHRMMNPRGSSTQHAATLLAKQTKGQRTSVTGRLNNLAGRKCYWVTRRSTWSPWQLLPTGHCSSARRRRPWNCSELRRRRGLGRHRMKFTTQVTPSLPDLASYAEFDTIAQAFISRGKCRYTGRAYRLLPP